MSDERCEQLGLVGFIIAGILFVAIGLRDCDLLVIAASVVWNAACLICLVPHFRRDE